MIVPALGVLQFVGRKRVPQGDFFTVMFLLVSFPGYKHLGMRLCLLCATNYHLFP